MVRRTCLQQPYTDTFNPGIIAVYDLGPSLKSWTSPGVPSRHCFPFLLLTYQPYYRL